jgi:methionyl-tRNA formyltransferase
MGQPLPGRIVFMGTPEFAAASLGALLEAKANVVAAFTQPDKPVGRKRILTEPAVKVLARSAGIPVHQPRTLKDAAVVGTLRDLRPDVIAVAAYGKILPVDVLSIPPMGCINVHASLLPRHRGASPIAHAIWSGDAETGVTIMRMEEGLDTGPMLLQRAVPMPAGATTESLTPMLAGLGGDLIVAALRGLQADILEDAPQDDALATHAPRLNAGDGRLDFGRPAASLERQVRAFRPWPGTFFLLDGWKIKVIEVRLGETARSGGRPGTVVVGPESLGVRCGDGRLLEILQLQREGRRPMSAVAFLRGFTLPEGTVLPTV